MKVVSLQQKITKVSVLTTVNKGRQFLEECVHSIKMQTLQDWEHLIVSDGATEEVLRYLESLTDPRQKVVYSHSIGRAKALNLGIKHCSSDFIAILDADDVANSTRLAVQLKIMDLIPKAAVLSSKCVVSKSHLRDPIRSINVKEITPMGLLFGSPICHSSTMIRKKSLIAVGGYDEKINKLLDLTLWKNLAVNKQKIFVDSTPLTYHRIHKSQTYEKDNRSKYLFAAFRIRKEIMKEFNISNLHVYKPLTTLIYGFAPATLRKKLKKMLKY